MHINAKKQEAVVLIAREHSIHLGPKIFDIFDIRKIFVSAKHDEAIYIVNMKKHKTKNHTPQFSLLISFLCLAYNIYRFTNCSYIWRTETNAPADLLRHTVDMKSTMD